MTAAATQQRTISLAHSPDSDDAFMFYALATNKIETGDLEFEHVLKDIQTLNEEARQGTYDVTAISFHAYAYVADKYVLLPHGASTGDNYGPVVVANEELDASELSNAKIAVPGTSTSAFLTLRIFNPDFKYEVDRKSTRLNSSHQIISYAVFCLKKKKKKKNNRHII